MTCVTLQPSMDAPTGLLARVAQRFQPPLAVAVVGEYVPPLVAARHDLPHPAIMSVDGIHTVFGCFLVVYAFFYLFIDRHCYTLLHSARKSPHRTAMNRFLKASVQGFRAFRGYGGIAASRAGLSRRSQTAWLSMARESGC